MKKKYLLFILLIIFAFDLYSQSISKNEVEIFVNQFISSKQEFSEIKKTELILSNENMVIGYLINLSPSGFIVTSANKQINPIISYSFRNNCSLIELGKTFIIDDLKNRNIIVINNKANKIDNRWEQYKNKINSVKKNTESIIEPLLTTKWYQSGIFNKYCPIDPETEERSLVGCVATATSQLLHYWKFPTSIHFNSNENYESKKNGVNILIPEDSNNYSFPNFTSINQGLEIIDYSDEDEIALLNFAAGIKNEMNYSSPGSGAHTTNEVYLDLGYGSAELDYWGEDSSEIVIENLKKGWPVQVSIRRPGGGHSVIFDGYDSDSGEFHVNLGWGMEPEETWYILPNIRNYNIISHFIYNICPNPSWSQYQADAQNSRRTTYDIPEINENKWNISIRSDYHFNGLIVGKGSQIIATGSPNSGNDNHPFVYFYSKEGDLIDKIELLETNEGLSIPVQSQNGDIYVISDHGKLFKIDQVSRSSELIFEEPNGTEITWGMKIDKSGNLYVSAWDIFYCLNSNGSIKWQKKVESGKYWVEQPAVDDVNGFVLYQYFNGSQEKKCTYVAYDIETGNTIRSKVIDATYGSKVGVPSITPEGTAYFGVHGTLYSFNPITNDFRSIIQTNGISKSSPTIGINGNLYISYWRIDDLVLASVDPSSNSILWEEKITTEDYDNIKEIYTDSNGRVCMTLRVENGSDPDTHFVAVFNDLGTSADLKWYDYYTVPGGNTFLGPDKTMYLIHSNKIVAISEPKTGESFNDYSNNNRPNEPQLISPIDNKKDEGLGVTFNWSASDLDGQTLKYDFYLGSSTEIISLIEKDITSENITISNLSPNITYLWKVVAKDGQSFNSSEIWEFSTIKDDDSDGVMNDVDNCPEVSNIDQSDLDGDGVGDVCDEDIDGDGILNEVDNCLEVSNSNQEDIDSDGIGDVCDPDIDGDGVANADDQCPNTPSNVNVDATGCPIFTLPSNNFTLEATSETCKDKNNGQIKITATETHSYEATVNGNSHNFSNNSLTVSNMQPGTYEVCITVSGETFEQCFNITIEEGTTVSGKASVSSEKASINIEKGTAPYNVFVNGQELFETNSLSFSLDVKHGDLVQVKTAKDCEGVFSKTINLFEEVTTYPNPTNGFFEIALPLSLKEVKIELYTTSSQLISSKTYSVVNGKVQLNIENMPAAMYFVKVYLENPVSVKIIKQ